MIKTTVKCTGLGGSDFATNESVTSANLNDTINKIATIVVPIGGVVGWLKSYTNTPALPAGFVECNGQTLSDAGSVYNGQVIPNLNASKFLRGAATSGGTGGSDTHAHQTGGNRAFTSGLSGTGGFQNDTGNYSKGMVAVDSKPPYYEVVWVMRVK